MQNGEHLCTILLIGKKHCDRFQSSTNAEFNEKNYNAIDNLATLQPGESQQVGKTDAVRQSSVVECDTEAFYAFYRACKIYQKGDEL